MTIEEQIAAVKAAVAAMAAAMPAFVVRLERVTTEVDALMDEATKLDLALDGVQAASDALVPPAPPAPKTVLDYGALGDGIADDTVAIQKAIDAGDGRVPAGRYLINSLRVASGTSFYGLLVGSGQVLECDPEAVFVVKPNSAPKNMCVRVDGGQMVGGQVLGDRLTHTYTNYNAGKVDAAGKPLPASTHEWGYGVQVRGTGSLVQGVKVSQCTGDGFGLSGSDVMIADCESTQNRRQGLSIFAVTKGQVLRSKFTKTGALNGQAGTNPRCGIDIEPDAGWVDGLLIDDCDISDNEVTGLVGWIRSDVVGGIRALRITNSRISGTNAIHMKALAGSIAADIDNCQITRTKTDRGNGLRVETGANVVAVNNTFAGAVERVDFEVTGRDSRTAADISTPAQDGKPLGVVKVGTNKYV